MGVRSSWPALGIYGLISFSVAQRERELGVRIALGATRGEIRKNVVGGGLRLTAIGLGIGLVAALALGRLASAALFGVSATDPVALGGTLVLFLGGGRAGVVRPGRARVDHGSHPRAPLGVAPLPSGSAPDPKSTRSAAAGRV